MNATLPPMTAAQSEGWRAMLDLYDVHPTGWTLVGGQMVHLHCAERAFWTRNPLAVGHGAEASRHASVHRPGRAGPSAVANRYFPGMPARSRALAPLTTAAVALALLTGCTDGTDIADPTPVPTSVPTTRVATPTLVPTPTPTPTPTAVDLTVPPVRPAAMETPSADGAAAAASYFISLYAYAYATGDYTQWDSLAAPNCEFCSSVRADIVGLHAQGRHRIGRIEVTSASGIELDPRHWYSATLHVVVAPAEDYDADGAVVDNHGEEVQDVGVALTWSDGWIVDEVGPTGPRG